MRRVFGYMEQTRLWTTSVALAARWLAAVHAADPPCRPSEDVAALDQWALLLCPVGFAAVAWLRFRTRLKL
jgi:hypothetical protein